MDGITFGPSGRRRFLQAVGIGTAAASLPMAATVASAAQETTTTAPPKRPVGDDAALLGFAATVELAAIEAYDTVLRRAESKVITVDDSTALVARAFREHHRSYAEALKALIGPGAPKTANKAVLAEFSAALTSSDPAVALGAAAQLENIATATHGSLVGQLVGTDGAALVASIMVIEARQATVLQSLLGDNSAPGSGLEDLSSALTPDKYPVQ